MATRAQLTAWSERAASVDPVAARLLHDHGPLRLGAGPRPDERFAALARSVCFQQLSGAAGATIWGRVVAAVGGRASPTSVLAAGPDALRGCGLSTAKAATVLGLADAVASGRLDLRGIARRDDEAVIEALTTVRGIGRWTAEMFLLFSLHRPDVWPVGDLGVRNGFALAHGLPSLTVAELGEAGERFRPYRSVVAWWCWRELDARRGQNA